MCTIFMDVQNIKYCASKTNRKSKKNKFIAIFHLSFLMRNMLYFID